MGGITGESPLLGQGLVQAQHQAIDGADDRAQLTGQSRGRQGLKPIRSASRDVDSQRFERRQPVANQPCNEQGGKWNQCQALAERAARDQFGHLAPDIAPFGNLDHQAMIGIRQGEHAPVGCFPSCILITRCQRRIGLIGRCGCGSRDQLGFTPDLKAEFSLIGMADSLGFDRCGPD